jgi:hypothetical protein
MSDHHSDTNIPTQYHVLPPTAADLLEFRQICADQGIILTEAEALDEAIALLTLYRVLMQPLPSEIAAHEREPAAKADPTVPPVTLPLL